MKFLGLITRCKDEFFVKEFVDYYLSQGVDHIYILDDNSINRSYYEGIDNNNVTIIYDKITSKAHDRKCKKSCRCNRVIASKLYKKIRHYYKWLIYCDVDEFITTKRNLQRTIRDELETTFKDADCIKIPWVMMSSNNREKNPKSILLENTYRWDHDKKHKSNVSKFRCRYKSIEVKCIFKPSKFFDITDHYPNSNENYCGVDGVNNKTINTNQYGNLREKNINNGILLCYHYRIISRENNLNKLKNNFWYINNKYALEDLMKSDYSEIKDETLNYKTCCNLIKKQFENDNSKHFLGLITRCKNEFFIEEFCNYYLNEGVNKIFILDDKSDNYDIYKNIKNDSRISIHYAKHNSKCHDFKCALTCTCNRVLANEIYKNVKDNFEWMIYVDVDEFIATKVNREKTIKEELETTYMDVDCISIPWIMMSAVNKTNPKSVLETNTFRINYDHKPKHKCNTKNGNKKFTLHSSGKQIQCKSIFKCKKFNGIHDINKPSDHHPVYPNSKNIKWLESVNNSRVELYNKNLKNINEEKINLATLLCYHYRVISEEHAISKLTTNDWYIENGYKLEHLMKTDNDINDETMKYKSINYKLKFIHITKTAGTYIENLAFKKSLFWGMNDFKLKYLKKKYKRNGPAGGSFWHEPIVFLNESPYEKNTKLFTIIRNPYDRIISTCLCKWGTTIKCKNSKKPYSVIINTVDDLNKYIKQQVTEAEDLSFHHFVPQYFYTHNSDGKQVIDFIIKYEELHKINELFKDYSIDIEFKENKNSNKKFSVIDISRENIDLINKIYHLDFVYYGYEKL